MRDRRVEGAAPARDPRTGGASGTALASAASLGYARSAINLRSLRAIAIVLPLLGPVGIRGEETGSEPRFDRRIRYAVDEPMRLDGGIMGKVGLAPAESEKIATEFELSSRYAIEERFLAVRDGEVVERTRFYERWEEGMKMNGIDVRDSSATYLQGRTLRFRKQGGEVEVEGVDPFSRNRSASP